MKYLNCLQFSNSKKHSFHGNYLRIYGNQKKTKRQNLFLGPRVSKNLRSKNSEHHFKATALMVNGNSQYFSVFSKGVSPHTVAEISKFCPKNIRTLVSALDPENLVSIAH